MESSDDEIDNSWINNFNKLEIDYKNFYKEVSQDIEIFFIYVDEKKEIESLKKINYKLDSGIIDKDKIIYLIKNYKIFNNKSYNLISLLKFNMNIEPSDVTDLFDLDDANEYLSSQRFLNNITFEDTISIFQDLNSLFMIFYASKPSINSTRKVYINKHIRKTKKKT